MSTETKAKKLTKYQKKKQKEEDDRKLGDAFVKFRNNPVAIKNFLHENIAPLIQKNPDKAKNAVKHLIGHKMTQKKYANILNTISSNNFTIEDFRKECTTSKLEPEIVILLEAIIATASNTAQKTMQEEIKKNCSTPSDMQIYLDEEVKPRAIQFCLDNPDKTQEKCAELFQNILIDENLQRPINGKKKIPSQNQMKKVWFNGIRKK